MPTGTVSISEADRMVIEEFLPIVEGETLKAYRDSGGILTIGVGHTGSDVRVGEIITVAQERQLEDQDLRSILAFLATLPATPPATTAEYLALASFAYNCGLGALKDVVSGAARIEHFIHDHKGQVQPGLVKRRRFELALLGMDVSVLDNPQPLAPK